MAPSRRQNGRSPLVNKQSQITTFFTKSSSSPTPSPSPSSVLSKQKPVRSRSPSPIAPSPLQSKLKKPLLVIGSTPSPPRSAPEIKSYGQEVVGKRIRVYWPLDKSWYEGLVQCFDKSTGKHLVQYDDADEEALDLGNEKIEWVEELVKSFKRLRRSSSTVPKAESEEKNAEEQNVSQAEPPVKRLKRLRRGSSVVLGDESGGDDDSGDEDWTEKLEKEELEDGDDQVMDLEDEAETLKGKSKGNREQGRHENVTVAGKLNMGKKNKSGSDAEKKEFKVPNLKPINDIEGAKATNDLVSLLTGDPSDRFKAREAEKFPFLGIGVRDANRRRPSDANYDPRTLYLPSDFLKSLTGGQRQWWEFKAKHMDKVLFFKMGKFYELFEMDAHIGAKELDLQYMKGEQPHCGFPEKNFSMNIEKLARKGYRVLVIEQTETPEQLEARRREKGVKDKVVKREVCAVVTKGTLTEGEMLSANPDASYLMAVTESCQSLENQTSERIFGVCVVDVATSRIILGQFMDDSECSALCCLLSELRPVEIIKPAKQLSPETEKVLVTHTRSPLVNELVPMLEFWDADKTVCEVKSTYKRLSCQLTSASSDVGDKHPSDSHTVEDEFHCLPVVLSKLVTAGENSFALSALGGALYYLKQAFLHETLLQFAKFELLPCSGFSGVAQKPYMVLDAAALENLEVFENSRNGGSSGTIYARLNHCVTAFGKRLLRTWLARPLYHVEPIKERQDAVAGLRGQNLPFALEFRKTVSKLQDMERLLARIFASSEANGRNADKVVLYEDAPKKKLQEFIAALRGCELMAQACTSLGLILENTESRLLHHLLTPGKGLPDIHSILKHFKDAFDWVEASNSGRIMPCEGVDMEYDSSCEKIKEIKSNLTKHLKEQKTLLGNASITYVTVGKDEYLLEVPESMSRTIPRDYELRSSKKGFYRYWTPNTKKLLGELSQAESEKESTLRCILQRLIGKFCEHHNKWRQLVSATAELDVFITLAIASEYYEGPTCRPVIIDSSCPNGVPHLSAKSLGHPVLRSDSLGKGTFVPNDISIGGSDQASFILLTGPNMGGKSTLLRQVCLAVILAQLGADVPAESFELSPVDRIFVRMGAKDHIMAGQSTFLTELSETSIMLAKATSKSLVVLDELGRGTATSDGQAIAESVLDHFVRTVRCRGMFSTHYHRLAMDYEKNPQISLCHMASQIGSTVDGVEEVVFLYRLTSGICPKSYGVNVARLAGIPNSVLQKAAAKSREFEAMYGKHGNRSIENLTVKNRADEMADLIKKLVNAAASISCHEPSNDRDTSYLTGLQHTARALQHQQ